VPVNSVESEVNTLRNNKGEEMMVEILLSAVLLIRKYFRLTNNYSVVSTILDPSLYSCTSASFQSRDFDA
jgi:hypothetical protein